MTEDKPTADASQPTEPEYVYKRVADEIEAQITSGRLPVAARLAGERELAAEHGVALGTIRNAIKELRKRGLVATLPAKGTFVRSTVRDDEREKEKKSGEPG